MAFITAQTIDASHSTFNDIGGNQYNIQSNQYNIQSNQYNIQTVQDGHDLERLREFLQPVDHLYPPACLPGTRSDIFEKINHWLGTQDSPNILLIIASPGAGKSCIASSMDAKLRERNRLGASFYFRHDNVNLCNPGSVWRTIAFDLSKYHPTLMGALLRVAEQRKLEPLRPDIDLHFMRLVHDILIDSWSTLSQNPPVVILDALDETSNSNQRRNFLSTLLKWASLPLGYRLLITSRNERLPPSLLKLCDHLELSSGETVSLQAHDDIRCFFLDGFVAIKEENDILDPDWPSKPDIETLTMRAAGLFVWAKTTLDFMQSGPPRGLLQTLLSGEPVKGDIDALYQRILDLSFSGVQSQSLDVARSILSIILLAKIPIPLKELHNFLAENVSQEEIQFVLKKLSSVILTAADGTLHVCHLSFSEFLFDSSRCGTAFAVNKALHSRLLVITCMRLMQKWLKFNICHIESSYLMNSDISNDQIERYIPKALSYACMFWASHLEDVAGLEGIDHEVSEFVLHLLKSNLLWWLEVMSLIRKIPSASTALLRAANAYMGENAVIVDLAMDARNFVSTFWVPITESVPHIYLSALPLSPQESRIYQNYSQHYPQIILLHCRAETGWPLASNVHAIHTGSVTTVVYSPDGKYLASGSDDNTMSIWDVATGEVVCGPLEGHSSLVTSIAYSPDGNHIASCSYDKTVRIWNITIGEMVCGPLYGHTYAATSVAYSPDGKCVASGSLDNKVKIWDATTGRTVSGPLEGHTDTITCVAYSPDGKYIASGSFDFTVRIWDVTTEEMVSSPLEGHIGPVTSVVYSPDGKHIASGSSDSTIRIWDVTTGNMVSGPLDGHNDFVTSVAYSPDGNYVASGSYDNTVRIWEVVTGKLQSGPLKGHTNTITSVAYSPDGKHVASGSTDKTVRVWDFNTGEMASGSADSHTNTVISVAYSPDGNHVASGSYDNTVRIWEVATGILQSGPFKGHADRVTSVAYSPDGKHVASGSYDMTVRIWDVTTGELAFGPYDDHTDYVTSVAYSPNGKHVASSSNDKTVRICDVITGQTVSGPLEGHTDWVRSVVYSPDGKHLASGSNDKTVRIWDVITGELALSPLEGHTDWVRSVAYSPDGKYVASGSEDKTVRIWDVTTGEIVHSLLSHALWVTSVAYSPDGKHVSSSSNDKTVRIWDTSTGKLVSEPLEGHSDPVTSIAYSPDGKHIASGSFDKIVRIWDLAYLETLPCSDISMAGKTVFSFEFFLPDSKTNWCHSHGNQKLFWVPPHLTSGLCGIETTMICGGPFRQLELSRFVHGSLWTNCSASHV